MLVLALGLTMGVGVAAHAQTAAPIAVATMEDLTRQMCALKPNRYIIHFHHAGTDNSRVESDILLRLAERFGATIFEVNVDAPNQFAVNPDVKVAAVVWDEGGASLLGYSSMGGVTTSVGYPLESNELVKNLNLVQIGADASTRHMKPVSCEEFGSF
jgi:hypothetical protein